MKIKMILLGAFLCTLLVISCKKDEFEKMEQKPKIDASLQLSPGQTLVTDQRILDSLDRCEKNPDSVIRTKINLRKKESLLEDFLSSATQVVGKIFQPGQKDPLTFFFNVAHLNPTSFLVATAVGVLNAAEGTSIKDSRVQKFFGPSYSGAILKFVFDYKGLPGKIKNGKPVDAAYTFTRKQYVNGMKKVVDDGNDYKIRVENPNTLTTFTEIKFPQNQQKDEYTLYLQSANGMYSLYLKDNDMLIMEKTKNKTSICVRNGKNLQLKNVPPYTEEIVSTIYTQKDNSIKTESIFFGTEVQLKYTGWTTEWRYVKKMAWNYKRGQYQEMWVQERFSVIGKVYKYICSSKNKPFSSDYMCAMLKNNGDFVFLNQNTGETILCFSKGFYGDISGKE